MPDRNAYQCRTVRHLRSVLFRCIDIVWSRMRFENMMRRIKFGTCVPKRSLAWSEWVPLPDTTVGTGRVEAGGRTDQSSTDSIESQLHCH